MHSPEQFTIFIVDNDSASSQVQDADANNVLNKPVDRWQLNDSGPRSVKRSAGIDG